MVNFEYREGELPGSWHSRGRPCGGGWLGWRPFAGLQGFELVVGRMLWLCVCGNNVNPEAHRLGRLL